MNFGSIFGAIGKGFSTVGEAIATILKLGKALQTAVQKCGPQTLTVMSQVFYDVMKSAALAEQAAQAGASGNALGTVTLSQQTISSVQQLWSDFKAAEAQVVADFKELQYDFTSQIGA